MSKRQEIDTFYSIGNQDFIIDLIPYSFHYRSVCGDRPRQYARLRGSVPFVIRPDVLMRAYL